MTPKTFAEIQRLRRGGLTDDAGARSTEVITAL